MKRLSPYFVLPAALVITGLLCTVVFMAGANYGAKQEAASSRYLVSAKLVRSMQSALDDAYIKAVREKEPTCKITLDEQSTSYDQPFTMAISNSDQSRVYRYGINIDRHIDLSDNDPFAEMASELGPQNIDLADRDEKAIALLHQPRTFQILMISPKALKR